MIFTLKREQFVNASLDEVWDFASSPHNLKRITPDHMGFSITSSDLSPKIYPGMIISYNVAPILKIKMKWVSEITQVVEKKYFVDEQRHGPYAMWHHQHFFEPHKNGVMMKDVITYKLPLGFIGNFVHWLFVKKKLNSIFDYRFQEMNKIFK